jgi:hypothetical protein
MLYKRKQEKIITIYVEQTKLSINGVQPKAEKGNNNTYYTKKPNANTCCTKES